MTFAFAANLRHTAPSPTHRLTDSPTHRLTDSPTHRLTDSPTHRLTDSPTHRHEKGRAVRARAGALALALGLLLCAGEAAAQTAVCSDTPGAGQRIACEVASGVTQDVTIDAMNPSISTSAANAYGVYGRNRGTGGIDIELTGAGIATAGRSASGVLAWASNAAGEGDVSVGVAGGAVRTEGDRANGVFVVHAGAAGRVSIDLNAAAITTTGANSYGVQAWASNAAGEVDVSVGAAGGSVRTEGGDRADGVYARNDGLGGVSVNLNDADIETAGAGAYGVLAWASNAASEADVSISLKSGGRIETAGDRATGVYARSDGLGGGSVNLNDVDIETTGASAYGVLAWASNAAGEADVSIGAAGGSVRTAGDRGNGVYARSDGLGGGSVNLNDVDIETTGASAYGVFAWATNAASEADVTVGAEGGSVTVEGLGARGLYGYHRGLGSVSMTTDAANVIEAPFAVGVEARLTNDGNAGGRLLVTNGGAVEARDVGVRARAARSSGSTFGEGTRTADDAARTGPMIHVASSGDVTVGESVTDAFIRNRVAGEDGTLSTGERAVLDAIAAGDSAALEAALDALPAAYDDDWKAEARELLRKRGYAPTSAAALASRAAGEILGLSLAGIRALALSHAAIADYVRGGDRDPAILAIAEASRTTRQQATLAEQEELSAAERAVLEAALTGGDLEGALAALPAAYADAWKDDVRRLAASYNAGDIRVDVAGGAITAEGNGVEALYAVPHARNGGIAVRVAEGASVTGDLNGLYLSGAGAGVGNFVAQSVSIDGEVRGGAGAGVYMKGGGRLTIGATGRVGATSGVGVLADGPGDFHAAVAGMVTGDIRGVGAGNHTVTVSPGGEVTGTIHLAASTVTVDGTVGAVRLDRGGMVTVGRGGVIRGAGGTAIRAGGGALLVDLNLNGRPFSGAAGGGVIIHNAGGKTTLLVNGVKLHDAETGGTGAEAPNGPRVVSLLPGAGDDGIFTIGEIIDVFAPRAGLYEALPGLLHRMESGRAREARTTAEGSPVWVRLSGMEGSRGARRSTSSAKYDFASFGAEAGLAVSFPWTSGLAGSVSVRHQRGEAEVSLPDDRGEVDLAGVGLGAGLSWRGGDGWYLRGEFSVMDYDADLTSKKWGRLRSGVGAGVRVLDVEAGRRLAPGERFALTPRAWLTRSRISMEGFTDALGARFSLVRGNRLTGGFGAAAESARPLAVGGGSLALRGSLDLETVLSGEKTSVEVSGERLHARAEKTRLLLGMGARWRAGRFSLDADLSASGPGSGEKTYGGRLSLGVRF